MGHECGYYVLEGAQDDYISICDYLAEAIGSDQASLAFRIAYSKKVKLIRSFPEMCPLSAYEELAERGYRCFLVKRYIVLYKHLNGTIFVAHIFHTSQDYARLVIDEDARVFGGLEAHEAHEQKNPTDIPQGEEHDRDI